MEWNGLAKTLIVSIIFSALYFTTFYIDDVLGGNEGYSDVIKNLYNVEESIELYNFASINYSSFYFVLHGLILGLGIVLLLIGVYTFVVALYLFNDYEAPTASIRLIYSIIFTILGSIIIYFNVEISSVYNNTYFYLNIEENNEIWFSGKLLDNLIRNEDQKWIVDPNSKLAFNINALVILMHVGFAVSLSTLLIGWYIIDEFTEVLENTREGIWWFISFGWIRDRKLYEYYSNLNQNNLKIENIEWHDIDIETETVSSTYIKNLISKTSTLTKNYYQSLKTNEQYLLEINKHVFKTQYLPMYLSFNELKALFISLKDYNFEILAASFYRFVNICTRNLSKYVNAYDKEYKTTLIQDSKFLYELKLISSEIIEDFLNRVEKDCKSKIEHDDVYYIQSILNRGEDFYDDYNQRISEFIEEYVEQNIAQDFEDEQDFVVNDEKTDLDLAFEFFGLTKNDSYDLYKKKYRELAKQYHPDSNNYDETLENKINLLNKHKMILDKHFRG